MDISINDDFFYKLVEAVVKRLKSTEEKKSDKWLTPTEAMIRLNIKSRTTLAKLRDNESILFTQYSKKSILYDAASIEKFLDSKIRKPLDD